MKKLLISATLLIGMMAGAMVLSSFTEQKEGEKTPTKIAMEDDGWEDYATVTLFKYERKNGEWKYCKFKLDKTTVQRRAWCGENEFRVKVWSKWIRVAKSPIEDYKYCAQEGEVIWCFDMY